MSLAIAFASSVAERAQAALAVAPSRRFSIGDARFDLVASATGHDHLSRALPQIDTGRNDVTSHAMSVWDGTDPQVSPPSRPWGARGHEPLGVVADYSDIRVRCAFDVHTSSLIVYDREAHRSYTWYPAIQALPTWAKASPVRITLSWLLNQFAMQMVHGAAVSIRGRAVLLAGSGGSGKSTTALVCALAGMGFLGDDYCAIDPARSTVHMVYRTAKALANTLKMVPRLQQWVVNPDEIMNEKAILFFDSADLDLVNTADLVAILLSRVSPDGRTRIVAASRTDAMRALLPSTIGGLMGGTEFTPRALLRLVQELPSFTIDLGTDIDSVTDAVSSVIEKRS